MSPAWERPQYFSLADRQVEHELSDQAFDDALAISLFFRQNLLIPDVFFFVSRHIERHVASKRSLFSAAVAKGLIVPAFRTPSRSFLEIHDAILDQGIVGYRPRARATAAALQAVCDGGLRTKEWPEGVGKSYANVLKNTLSRSPEEIEEAAKSVDARRLWEATRPFREDTLDAAREATPKGGGIRRGAIYAALAAQLPSPPAPGEVEDSGRLVARFKDAHDPRTGDLAHFLAWVDGLYQVNHAQTLSAQPWIPPMDPFDSLVVSLAGAQPEASASAPEPAAELEIEVRLPKIDRLFGHHDPAAVLAIRAEAGADYRRALWLHMAAPTADTANELTKATKSYAKQLCKHVAAPVQVWRVKTRPLPGGAKEILTPAIAIGGSIAGWLVGVPVAAGVTAVGAGAMIVRKGRRRTATEKRTLRFPSLLLPAS